LTSFFTFTAEEDDFGASGPFELELELEDFSFFTSMFFFFFLGYM